SGTKLAMEDGIALYEAFRATGGRDVAAALRHFELARREEVEKTQHSADVSLVWFEHVDRFWNMDPTRFAFGLMTRSKAITYANLALRAPEFVSQIERVVARDTRAIMARTPRGHTPRARAGDALGGGGGDVAPARVSPVVEGDGAPILAPMFQPFRLRGMTL